MLFRILKNTTLIFFSVLIYMPGVYQSLHVFYSSHNHTQHDCCDLHDYHASDENSIDEEGESCYVLNFEFYPKHQNPEFYSVEKDLFILQVLSIEYSSNYTYSCKPNKGSRSPPEFS